MRMRVWLVGGGGWAWWVGWDGGSGEAEEVGEVGENRVDEREQSSSDRAHTGERVGGGEKSRAGRR